MKNKILQGDALKVLKTLKDESVDMVITSPPYWALRDYGVEGQLGLEPTFQEYINKLCDIFDEVKRVLKKEGTCWVNMGDTYGGSGGDSYKTGEKRTSTGIDSRPLEMSTEGNISGTKGLQKCLLQIPSRFAIEMTNRGWILRNEIIWHKPNCMPSSVKDRFTVDFEKLFFFVKSKKYYFEQQLEPQSPVTLPRLKRSVSNHHKNLDVPGQTTHGMHKAREKGEGEKMYNPNGRNKRTVWTITTKSYKEAHFAVYPKKLIEIPIKAGCPKGGIVLDPFIGSGTTAEVARDLDRDYLGIELNPDYITLIEDRLKQGKLL